MRLILLLLSLTLAACLPDPATPTATRSLSGPTTAPTLNPFTGAPTEARPNSIGGEGQNDPTVAAMPNEGALPPLPLGDGAEGIASQPVEVIAEDGTLLYGDLYQPPGERAPGVLLLGLPGTAWGESPAVLFTAGYTVLVMDLRADVGVADFRVMLEALMSGVADPSRLGVVAAAEASVAALAGCGVMPSCDALVLLSPLTLELLDVLPTYDPRPLLLIASAEDDAAVSAVTGLDAAATVSEMQITSEAGRGAAIVTNRPAIMGQISEWLDRHLRNAD